MQAQGSMLSSPKKQKTKYSVQQIHCKPPAFRLLDQWA
jgi:hypothetical protein